jgi:tetratricopeptide (TPR) repeat protein
MATLLELERDLERALKLGDLDQIASVRRTIAGAHTDTPAGGEASYKLGLDALFRRKNLDEAAEHFRGALKSKSPWSAAARTSLAIVQLKQGKVQQAMLELRKVASASPPTIAGAYAQGLLVIALREAKLAKEAERAHDNHKKMLARVAETASGEDKALAHLLLALEHKFDGERDPAKKNLQAALSSKALSPDDQARAQAALAEV